MTTVKCLLENSKALRHKKGPTEVVDFKIAVILIKSKLPTYFVSRIMNIADALISQIRQPSRIVGYQVCNPSFIKSSQQGGGPNNGH